MIEFADVSKTYKNTGDDALKEISLEIRDGEFVFITGPSGSGKTSLFRLLTAEIRPTSGELWVGDQNIRRIPFWKKASYRRRLGVVFQDFKLLEDRNVYENVAFAALIAGKNTREIRSATDRALSLVGLLDKRKHYPRQLSGGEKQRTAIARAIVNRPEILLLDEPTGNLDGENISGVLDILEKINRRGTTIVFITHDTNILSFMDKRTVELRKGMIVSDTGALEMKVPNIRGKSGSMKASARNESRNPDHERKLRLKTQDGIGKIQKPVEMPKSQSQIKEQERKRDTGGHADMSQRAAGSQSQEAHKAADMAFHQEAEAPFKKRKRPPHS